MWTWRTCIECESSFTATTGPKACCSIAPRDCVFSCVCWSLQHDMFKWLADFCPIYILTWLKYVLLSEPRWFGVKRRIWLLLKHHFNATNRLIFVDLAYKVSAAIWATMVWREERRSCGKGPGLRHGSRQLYKISQAFRRRVDCSRRVYAQVHTSSSLSSSSRSSVISKCLFVIDTVSLFFSHSFVICFTHVFFFL